MRCDGCSATLFSKQVEQNDKVCPECNHHFPVSAVERIMMRLDFAWHPGRPEFTYHMSDRPPALRGTTVGETAACVGTQNAFRVGVHRTPSRDVDTRMVFVRLSTNR